MLKIDGKIVLLSQPQTTHVLPTPTSINTVQHVPLTSTKFCFTKLIVLPTKPWLTSTILFFYNDANRTVPLPRLAFFDTI